MTPVIRLSDGYLANSYENIIGGNVSCEEENNEFMVKNRQNKINLGTTYGCITEAVKKLIK